MKTLIVDDDFINRLLLQEILKDYGQVHVAVNGKEAVAAVHGALGDEDPYDLVCLDIMMPEMDGQEALSAIRAAEGKAGIKIGNGTKVIMTTALGDKDNVMQSFREACDDYLVKPIAKTDLINLLHKHNLIS